MKNKYQQIKAINASLLKNFLESEKQGKYYIDNPPEQTQALTNGTFFHDFIEAEITGIKDKLEGYVVFDDLEKKEFGANPNRRKKDYQEWKKSIIQNSFQLIDKEIQIATKNFIKSSIFKELKAMGGEPEIIFTGKMQNIPVKSRFDYYIPKENLIVDWKTIGDLPTKKNIARAIYKFKYELQAAFYAKMAELADHQEYGFLFVFVQTKQPYEIGLFYFDNFELNYHFENNIKPLLAPTWDILNGKQPRFIYELNRSEWNSIGAFSNDN